MCADLPQAAVLVHLYILTVEPCFASAEAMLNFPCRQSDPEVFVLQGHAGHDCDYDYLLTS